MFRREHLTFLTTTHGHALGSLLASDDSIFCKPNCHELYTKVVLSTIGFTDNLHYRYYVLYSTKRELPTIINSTSHEISSCHVNIVFHCQQTVSTLTICHGPRNMPRRTNRQALVPSILLLTTRWRPGLLVPTTTHNLSCRLLIPLLASPCSPLSARPRLVADLAITKETWEYHLARV